MSVLDSDTVPVPVLPSTLDIRGEILDIRAEVRKHDASEADTDSGTDTDTGSGTDTGTGTTPRAATRRRPRPSRMPPGVRVRRVRIGSIANIAAVFFTVGAAAVLGALVAFWTVVQQLVIVDDIERLAIQSLGLDSFAIDGQRLFELSAIVVAALFGMGFVITLLLTLVYNAACSFFGGVALEFAPLRRRKRVFSPRHRRFVSV